MGRPSSSLPCRLSMASSIARSLLKLTKPKPRECPDSLSTITLASSTLPNGRNASSSPLSVVLHDNPPTKHLNSSGSTSAMDPHCDANPKSPLLSTFNKGLKTKTWNPPKQKEKQDLDAIQSSILETLLEGHEERKEKKESNKISLTRRKCKP
jgi:hypothetical protein